MASSASNDPLTDDLREKRDAVRRRFEDALNDGKSPKVDDYLADFSGAAREQLAAELTKLQEQHQPPTRGASATNAIPIEADDVLMTIVGTSTRPPEKEESEEALDSAEVTRALDSQANKQSVTGYEPTIAHTGSKMPSASKMASGSTGLQIRCPHCSNGVELLADTAFDDIACTDCGSTFNLVDRETLATAAKQRKTIGRFDLEERLGAGGFGTVWKARDRELDRIVAIKIPRKGQLEERDIEQFYREARAAAQLSHPNIVAVHEVGREDKTVFIVSDMIHGVSLSEWTLDQRCNSHDVALIMVKVADALQHAHDAGIIHRDLKPSNIMMDQAGEPHIMDFGLAKRELGEVTMTVEGQILGTPSYMSPEQAGGKSHWVDRRSDIYSLGVMMFKMLTNELPFRGSIRVQIEQRLTQDAPDPRTLNKFIPRDMSTICLKCLERDPNSRFATAQELLEELRRFLRGEPILSRPISKLARAGRWAKRHPAVATAGALATFLAIAGPTAAYTINQQRTRLEASNLENQNTITRLGNDAAQYNQRIDTLEKQIELLEGRANPWEIWAENPKDNPRALTLKRLYEQQYTTIAAGLDAGDFDPRQQACGHLALAMIADKALKSEDAIEHYQHSAKLLQQLSKTEWNDVRYQQALAHAYTALARLQAADDRDAAKRLLEQALAINKQLAEEHSQNGNHWVDWMESELQHAAMGIGPQAQHLIRGRDLEQRLRSKWPSDPVEMYRVVSYLTRQPPVLLEPTRAETKP